jgi:hypothetical protein
MRPFRQQQVSSPAGHAAASATLALTQQQGDLCVGSGARLWPVVVGTQCQPVWQRVGNTSGGRDRCTAGGMHRAIRTQLQGGARAATAAVAHSEC